MAYTQASYTMGIAIEILSQFSARMCISVEVSHIISERIYI